MKMSLLLPTSTHPHSTSRQTVTIAIDEKELFRIIKATC